MLECNGLHHIHWTRAVFSHIAYKWTPFVSDRLSQGGIPACDMTIIPGDKCTQQSRQMCWWQVQIVLPLPDDWCHWLFIVNSDVYLSLPKDFSTIDKCFFSNVPPHPILPPLSSLIHHSHTVWIRHLTDWLWLCFLSVRITKPCAFVNQITWVKIPNSKARVAVRSFLLLFHFSYRQ